MCTYNGDDASILKDAIKSAFNNSIKPDKFILTIDGPIPKKIKLIRPQILIQFKLII